jgi:hypothetical protein
VGLGKHPRKGVAAGRKKHSETPCEIEKLNRNFCVIGKVYSFLHKQMSHEKYHNSCCSSSVQRDAEAMIYEGAM